ncbi:ubiquinone biosynthesis protein COQ4 homolog, mitochondrial-like [Oscarella lobularis]|uniref:ubiquinone biosynthesis protein COQ4 homolog, mitochondrial-like n=1 Tax=Oscarella lobularis TaxID=121494 RepID=UPI003314446D
MTPKRILYAGHEPLSSLQRLVLAGGSALMALYDPARSDMVAALGETTGESALFRMQRRMRESDEGRRILEEKPRISTKTIDLEKLRSLPESSLGHRYVTFLGANHISPDTRLPVKYVRDPNLAYVMTRYREIHDFVHALLGMPVSLLGEVVVKWFEMIQTGLPMTTLASFFGPLRLTNEERVELVTGYMPWVTRSAVKTQFLMNIYYEKRFEQNLDDFYKEIGFVPYKP